MIIQKGPVVWYCNFIPTKVFNELWWFGEEHLNFWQGSDWRLHYKINHSKYSMWIIKDVKCLHACGPYYAKMYWYLDEWIYKYKNSHPDLAKLYKSLKDKNYKPAQQNITKPKDFVWNNPNKIKYDFTIIILTRNREKLLKDTLKEIKNKTKWNYELIIWLNWCTDNSLELVKKYNPAKIISKSTNIWLELYKELYNSVWTDYIIWIDDDVIELPDWYDEIFFKYHKIYKDYWLLGLDCYKNKYTNWAKPEDKFYRIDKRDERVL